MASQFLTSTSLIGFLLNTWIDPQQINMAAWQSLPDPQHINTPDWQSLPDPNILPWHLWPLMSQVIPSIDGTDKLHHSRFCSDWSEGEKGPTHGMTVDTGKRHLNRCFIHWFIDLEDLLKNQKRTCLYVRWLINGVCIIHQEYWLDCHIGTSQRDVSMSLSWIYPMWSQITNGAFSKL